MGADTLAYVWRHNGESTAARRRRTTIHECVRECRDRHVARRTRFAPRPGEPGAVRDARLLRARTAVAHGPGDHAPRRPPRGPARAPAVPGRRQAHVPA